MVLRQLFSKALLPNLERDISRSVTKEVAAIDELMFLAPRIFSYQKSQGGAGVFGRTATREAPAASELIRVERPVVSKGLFQE